MIAWSDPVTLRYGRLRGYVTTDRLRVTEDKVNTEADARHREDLAMANDQRLAMAEQHTAQLEELIQQNTALTDKTTQRTY